MVFFLVVKGDACIKRRLSLTLMKGEEGGIYEPSLFTLSHSSPSQTGIPHATQIRSGH